MSERRVLCPRCRTALTVAAHAAGARVRCPQCGTVLTLPAATVAVPASQAGTVAPRPAPAEDRTLPPRNTPPDDLPEAQNRFAFLAPPASPEELGRLGSYRVLKVLGAGGMGVVFLAEDVQLRRRVALKAMLPALAVSASARQRFLREAQAIAAVEHDHIVAIYQVGEEQGTPFFAMPLLEGESLEARLKRQSVLPVAEAVRLARETALGLAAAHAHGLVHRDIKPANIWLEKRASAAAEPAALPRVKLLDFGLALGATTDGPLTQAGAILGTPGFMAPEQLDGSHVDARADLFSLGCVLYRMVAGKAPFRGKDTISTLMAVASEQPPPPETVNPRVPPALSALIQRLLAKTPGDRPQTAGEVAKQLEALALSGADPSAAATAAYTPDTIAEAVGRRPAALPKPPDERSRRRLLMALGGLGLCAVLALILFLGLRRKAPPSEAGTKQPPAPVSAAPPKSAGNETGPLLLAAPDLSHTMPLHEDDFDDPESGFPTGAFNDVCEREYSAGRYRITNLGRGWSYWNTGWPERRECAGQVAGRVQGPPAARWGVHVVHQKKALIIVGIDGNGELHIGPGPLGDEPALIADQKPIRHPAIRPGHEFNTILAILKEHRLEVYVNGWSVCAPVPLESDPGLFHISLGLRSPAAATAEFEHITIWSAADLPAAAKRPTPFGAAPQWPADLPPGDRSAPKLTTLLTDCDFAGPASGWPAKTLRNDQQREYGSTSYERGLYSVRLKSDSRFYWYRGKRYPDFAAEMVARLVEPATGRWGIVVVYEDPPHNHSIAIWLNGRGELEINPAIDETQKFLGPQVGPLTHHAIRPAGEANRLRVVVRKQLLEVFVNGTAVCAPIPLQRPLTPAVLGLCVQARGQPAQVDFSQWRVAAAADLPP